MTVRIRAMRETDAAVCARIACESEIGARYRMRLDALEARLRSAAAGGSVVFVAECRGGGRHGHLGNPVTGETEDGVDGLDGDPAGACRVAGFAWVEPRGAFGIAPYLKLVAVDPAIRGSGVGAALLAAYESSTAGIGAAHTLLVSDFNLRAIAFYERHGYRRAGLLPDFAAQGIAEILMIKPAARPPADPQAGPQAP